MADAAGTTVWRWDQVEPFGNNPADENPSGLGAFDLPLRLPGQRYDKETGLHYNYFRDYDPSIGRYEESDPIGLDGGLNTYVHVELSPLSKKDVLGLLVRLCSRRLSFLPFRIAPLGLEHDFIDLNGTDWGFHCDGCWWSGPGIVKSGVEKRPFMNCKEIKCVNEYKLITDILKDQANPPEYKLCVSDCQTWSQEKLRRALDPKWCKCD